MNSESISAIVAVFTLIVPGFTFLVWRLSNVTTRLQSMEVTITKLYEYTHEMNHDLRQELTRIQLEMARFQINEGD